MSKIKETPSRSALKSAKPKFNKNRSFSGIEIKKSPKNRRKSLAAVVPTPKKQKPKKEIIINEWIVKEDVAEETVSLPTPKSIKKKKIEITNISGKGKKGKAPKDADTTIYNAERVSLAKSVTEDKPLVPANDNFENLRQFDINFSDIKKAVEGVIKFHASNPKLENQLFQERVPLFLQICCHKIPKGNPKILRIPLPNSAITADDEICLIVPEVKGVKNIEHEKHVEHYEELLRKKGVENINKIMTFHEFRTEHETFEQKSRLVDLYDVFLVDGRICGKVVSKCGSIFYKKRKVPGPVKLHVSKLREHVEKALSKVFCHLHLKGDSYNVQFGHNKMEVDDLVLNILSIVETLDKEFPGGFKNVKGLHVRIERAPSIPIYMSFADPKGIKMQKLNSKKPKAYKSYKDELTTLPNAEVTVRPSGQVLVTRVKQDENEGDNMITDADIIKANKDSEGVDENKKKRMKNKRIQVEVAEVAKKKFKVEINPKVGKQPVARLASTPKSGEDSGSKVAKKQKQNNLISIPKNVEASDKALKKKTKMNVRDTPREVDASLSKVVEKSITVVSKPKKTKIGGSGENLKISKKVSDRKIVRKTKKKGTFTI